MIKKRSDMSAKLKILSVTIARPSSVADVARGAPPRLNLTIEVENTSNEPLYVWTDLRRYDYDPSTHVVSVQLAEIPRDLPPHIKMISDHPREPIQVVVKPKGHMTIKVQLPGSVRRLTPGKGLGKSFAEIPIGQIDRVEVTIQHAVEPIKLQPGEAPANFRKRLCEHGDVAQATIPPTADKKEK